MTALEEKLRHLETKPRILDVIVTETTVSTGLEHQMTGRISMIDP